MRKFAAPATLISGLLILGGLVAATPAMADDEDHPKPNGTSGVLPSRAPHPSESDGDVVEKKHRELEQKYGGKGRLSLPPLVIRPQRDSDDLETTDETDDVVVVPEECVSDAATDCSPATTTKQGLIGSGSSSSNATVKKSSTGFIAVSPQTIGGTAPAVSAPGTPINPEQSVPINIQQASFNEPTPAEVFIQASQVGLYVMGAGALALGAVAGSRAIRRK